MLSLEAIGVLGILYCFFMYGTLRAIHAKRAVRRSKAELEAAAAGTALETVKQTP